MKNAVLLKLAASALVIGSVAVGCTSSTQTAGLSPAVAKAETEAAKAAAEAKRALAAGKAARAVATAEKAVGLAPRNGGYRTLLGQAYLKAGRFASAEASLADALSLDGNQPQAVLSLALAQIAQGKNEVARNTILQARDLIPGGDAGLALALAGDRDGSIAVLQAAARAPGADAKVRQNLALALALADRWNEASVVAAQDVPADQLGARLQKWAAFARPRAAPDQVAALLGVTPATDPGMPTQLALATQPAPAEALATAPEPAEEAASVVQPVETASVPAFAPTEPVAAPADPVEMPSLAAAMESASPDGRYVVQLGAYSSPARAELAWNSKVGRMETLAGYVPGTARVRRRDETVHRLAALGFDSRAEAERLCGQLKVRGSDCFVRVRQGDAPMRWASRRGPAYASR